MLKGNIRRVLRLDQLKSLVQHGVKATRIRKDCEPFWQDLVIFEQVSSVEVNCLGFQLPLNKGNYVVIKFKLCLNQSHFVTSFGRKY